MTNYYDDFVSNVYTKLADPTILLEAFSQPVKGRFGQIKFDKIDHDAVSFIISLLFQEEEYLTSIGKQCEVSNIPIMNKLPWTAVEYLQLIQNIHDLASPDDRANVISYLKGKANE